MSVVFRAMFGYLFLVLMVRIVGRRPGKQLTPFEFVLVFFMGGLILTPLIGPDRSATNAFLAIMTIALMHFVLAWLKQRSIWFTLVLDGMPLVLLEKHQWIKKVSEKHQVNHDDVMASARESGVERLDQIDYAVLERNGEISVIKLRDPKPDNEE